MAVKYLVPFTGEQESGKVFTAVDAPSQTEIDVSCTALTLCASRDFDRRCTACGEVSKQTAQEVDEATPSICCSSPECFPRHWRHQQPRHAPQGPSGSCSAGAGAQ